MRIQLTVMCAVLGIAAPVLAQPAASGSVLAADLAVPFGTVAGRILLLDDYLVFVDDQQPETSFVVSKRIIENLSAEGSTITVRTREAVRNRSGESTQLSFRLATGADPAAATGWFAKGVSGTPPAAPGPATSGSAAAASVPAGSTTYQARHNHLIGDCRGRLVVAPDQLIFESVSDVSHSRRWEYKSIKEISHPNPYELEVKPFSGGNYKLLLDGSGMGPAEYTALVDKVTSARTGR